MLDEKRLKGIIKENEEYLTLLEELDRTGKLRKARYKERVNFTIDEQVLNEFRRYCEDNNLKMSGLIESMIKEFLANHK